MEVNAVMLARLLGGCDGADDGLPWIAWLCGQKTISRALLTSAFCATFSKKVA
jgi:hypothetical protein